MFRTIEELISQCKEQNISVAQRMKQHEAERMQCTVLDIENMMQSQLEVMESAIAKGFAGVQSTTKLTGGDAPKVLDYIEAGDAFCGPHLLQAVAAAMATNEVNAAMGRICATPTAGSAGVVPGALYGVSKQRTLTKKQKVDFLFTAGAFGLVIANNASISGAEGGCQAEVGSASGMAAAALVSLRTDDLDAQAHALAIAIKGLLGLVCDPVAGLVEVPCVKRNAVGVSNAMMSADLALAGVRSVIPPDEVVSALKEVGMRMCPTLRETAGGGLANTPTARRLEKTIFTGE
ncbi:MAG: L-serine ammonia-lyase, iron-sulfur-dependent, subunit alpha [Bacilli bacterium]